MLRNILGVLAPAFFAFVSFPANSMPSMIDNNLFAAFDYSDVTVLEKINTESDNANIKLLSNIMLLTIRHKEGEALALYGKLDKNQLSPQLRCAADLNKAMIFERQRNHSQVISAIASAAKEANCASPFIKDTRTLHASLGGVRTDILSSKERGVVALKRDPNKLPLASVSINGHVEEALIDTASTFNVTSATNAKNLGLRAVQGTSQVTTANGRAVVVNIAIASDFQFGNNAFKNALFVVLPDGEWPDPTDQVIIGMSLLNQLGRIEFDHTDGSDRLVYGHSIGEQTGPPNMIFHWWQPYVIARVNSDSTPARILIDTGANKTIFNQTLLVDHPSIEHATQPVPLAYQGIDGANVDKDALIIPNIDFGIGTANVNIKNGSLIKSAGPSYHGLFGQETLLSSKRVVIDFDNMYFSMN